MRILLFSTLYPNAAMPTHGVFVENRLRAYLNRHDADVKVIAPVPWFPFSLPIFGAWADWARAPRSEIRDGVDVLHPRYLAIPKIGMTLAPGFLAQAFRRTARKLIEDGWDFDLIDAHYFYPDGVAAAIVARELGKPLAITARGTDVNLIPENDRARKAIIDASCRADAVITVAEALKTELAALGAPAEKITVLRNGVDLEDFKPADREAARRKIGVEGLVIASVGHLIERKGHDRVIAALKDFPDATLIIAGDGPQRRMLEAQAKSLGVDDRVRFLGRVEHRALVDVYNAADILVLASSREGWPNVLLEAMACGTPCVATDVWGAREVITAPAAGRLAASQEPAELGAAVREVLAARQDRAATRTYAEGYSWEETADGMAAIFDELEDKARRAAALKVEPILIDENYRPRLIVTVDTEETFDWTRFDVGEQTVENTQGLERFQRLCDGMGVKPIYFLTWALLKDEVTASFFKNLRGAKAADCGLHLHQWAMPGDQFTGEFYSFQKNLPRKAYLKKLRMLAAAYADLFGDIARAHRAGRYGVSPADYELLAEIGVRYDFSPSAAFDFSARGGPDFSAMSNKPFFAADDKWKIAVTPVSGAKAWRRTSRFLSQETAPPGFAGYRNDPWLSRKKPMRLSPEAASLSELQALTRRLVADRTPVLTYTLHSTSLTPGANAYAPDAAAVERLIGMTREYFAWFADELNGGVETLDGLAALYKAAPGA